MHKSRPTHQNIQFEAFRKKFSLWTDKCIYFRRIEQQDARQFARGLNRRRLERRTEEEEIILVQKRGIRNICLQLGQNDVRQGEGGRHLAFLGWNICWLRSQTQKYPQICCNKMWVYRYDGQQKRGNDDPL